MKYVDGFVFPVPKKKLAAYKRLARVAAKVWKDHGALAYFECIGDDLNVKFGLPFPRIVKPKAGETIWFSWIVYKSKSQRNRICKLVMKDPRLEKMMDPKTMPFDMKRMSCGGFKVQVEA